MASTNLGPRRGRVSDAVKRVTVPTMQPAEERKAIVIKTRRNGSSVRLAKEAAKERAKAKEKEKGKQNQGAAETGRVMARSYLAPTTTRAMATVNGATTVVSPMMGQKGKA